MHKGHFSVINKRGLATACIIMAGAILLFSLSLANRLSGGSILWTIPVVAAIIVFLLALMILTSVLTAGIDVEMNQVIFADASGVGGKKPQFQLSDLKDVQLYNAQGVVENPTHADLTGGRIVFLTDSGDQYTYYPVAITARQYRRIHDELLVMAQEAREYLS